MLTFLDREGEAGIDELALRFGMNRREVVSELELAACCGLPPYTPDQLIELIVDTERVFATHVGELGRQRRLTPAEAFELVLAARAILAVPGADRRGALASALAKLEEVLGEDRLVLDIEQPEHLEELRVAVDAHEQVELEYFSSSRGEPTSRLVDPHRVVALEGRWYLDGFCHRAGSVRRFQVDRVRSVTMTGRPSVMASFDRPPAPDPTKRPAGSALIDADPGQGRAFVPGPDARPVRIEMPAEMSWAVERASEGQIEPAGPDRVVVTVFAGSRNWLENLLLRLGPRAEVLDPPEMQGVAGSAARRLLRLYRE
jgi:proteasome accessory factor C